MNLSEIPFNIEILDIKENFIMGIILYDGDHSTQHEDKLYSVPIGSLWE